MSPVSIGILPVERARGLMLWKVSMKGNVYYVMSAKYELSISVRLNTFKTKDILVLTHKGVYK